MWVGSLELPVVSFSLSRVALVMTYHIQTCPFQMALFQNCPFPDVPLQNCLFLFCFTCPFTPCSCSYLLFFKLFLSIIAHFQMFLSRIVLFSLSLFRIVLFQIVPFQDSPSGPFADFRFKIVLLRSFPVHN